MQGMQPPTSQSVVKIYAKLFELWSDRQADCTISKLQYRQKELHRLITKLQQIDEQGTDLPPLQLLDLEAHEVLPFFVELQTSESEQLNELTDTKERMSLRESDQAKQLLK